MNMQPESEYVLGASGEELARLKAQHDVWAGEAAGAWRRAGFGPGMNLLDVGCGPGFSTMDLARLVGPSGSVVGVDRARRFIEQLETRARSEGLEHVNAMVGDVEWIDFDRLFDGAFCRWLLCFVCDPRGVIANVAGSLRPDGVFVVQDYYHYDAVTVGPPSELFQRVYQATGEAWRRRGGDPDIGRRVPELMIEAGFDVVDVRSHSRITRPGSDLWRWPEEYLRNFLPQVIEMGLLDEAEVEAFWKLWGADVTDAPGVLCDATHHRSHRQIETAGETRDGRPGPVKRRLIAKRPTNGTGMFRRRDVHLRALAEILFHGAISPCFRPLGGMTRPGIRRAKNQRLWLWHGGVYEQAA